MTILTRTRMKLTSNYWKWKGFVPGVTWGLNLMLGDAPAKGSVQKILTHLSDPLFFLTNINNSKDLI